MSPHWNDVIPVFEILAYIVKSADPDGIDLYFTMTDEVYNNKRSTFLRKSAVSKLVSTVEARRTKLRGSSNITWRLDSILEPYITKLRNGHNLRTGGVVRPLNLYILTDGVWEDKVDASGCIKGIVEKLKEFGYRQDSNQIGIQFISYGKDQKGLKRLQDLDDNLGQTM